ncbi:MAG TPA: 3-hydroxyacyl-CoA dehydrogenase NAD-binding domain-containing protein [Acidobacteriota bacterium]|nr:3-hydroxyacyl-CoA dehydrogenase NAD-binding domain-containing protein [Acidobacteriota bacterium]
MQINSVAVIGAGTMGRGIAQVSAMSGFQTRLYDVSGDALDSALKDIATNLRKGRNLGKITEDQWIHGLRLLETTRDLNYAVSTADFIFEATPEDAQLKVEVLERCAARAPGHAVFATNTSSLTISELAVAIDDPSRLIGMHFFNPVHIMKLVEIVPTPATSASTCAAAETVARCMGKETVQVKESPGFVTTRLNALIGNEAFWMLYEGLASARDIDKAVKLGLNHPMGPFELVDLVGLDTRLSILRFLHARLGEKYRPCPLLEQYVQEGRLGRKVGRGVYEY